MGKSQARKGAAAERELASVLTDAGYNVRRGGSRTYGTVPDCVGLPGIHIECKHVERLNVEQAMQQAERDSVRFHDGIPAVFHRRNRTDWLVTMRLDDWLLLYELMQPRRND